jgi:hypothetical protein
MTPFKTIFSPKDLNFVFRMNDIMTTLISTPAELSFLFILSILLSFARVSRSLLHKIVLYCEVVAV